MRPGWEAVIGMEVHAQLSTRSKMFCTCSSDYLAAEPNAHVCEVCLGLPGALPVANGKAVEQVIRTALALNCKIAEHSKFDRKNYFYPDLPKGYQISQYDMPLSLTGWVDIPGRRVRITRVHLEEDTGKLVHAGDALATAQESLVDLNRAGVPLMEIVSEPDLTSADEARDYAQTLRAVLRAIGASEAEMEKGQLRAEANVSVRKAGAVELGVKTELKNINSFRSLHRAVEFEIDRQIEVLESGGEIVQETRGWSEPDQRTFSQRRKEFADDYRYFPEPDLPPLTIDPVWVEGIREALPELPHVRSKRLVEVHGITEFDAGLLVQEGATADLFEATVAAGAPAKPVANWMISHQPELDAARLAELVNLVVGGTINRDQALEVMAQAQRDGSRPGDVVRDKGLAQVSDEGALGEVIGAVIAEFPQAAADFRSGNQRALGALLAEVKKKTDGRANMKLASQLLRDSLKES
ncbi:MAG TPA: Asp-tRNA(Asn)/Glu-tRNA(Gln) amidotransferase subunit GatB [Candidatus Dormibacteraeota bacterium]|jgi:aspartyl-tRNA(Asn)/glutamyl-tRNA(Gln) amidotransferase subunit B|nr:Asp-tRNA(Asn)/Glu-tRNA(Gln) amidotransferase subunit GatB [Candidatus Dormibacteraeota bacterium]